jgi:hypothetical protein
MPGCAELNRSGLAIKDAVPDRKDFVAVFIHLKGPIESGQHRDRVTKIAIAEASLPQEMQDRDRQKGSSDPVTNNIEHVDRQVVFIQP